MSQLSWPRPRLQSTAAFVGRRDGFLARALSIVWIVIFSLTPISRFIAMQFLPSERKLVLALVVVTFLLGYYSRPRGSAVWLLALVGIPIVGLIAGTHSSILPSLSVAVQLAILVGITPGVIAFFSRRDSRWIGRVAIGFVIVQSLSALAGVLQIVANLSFLGVVAREGRGNGLAGHPNVLAIEASVTISVLIFALIKRRAPLVLAIGLIVLNFVAVLLSGSLSSLLALVIGVAVQLVAARIAVRALVVGLVTVAGAALVSLLTGVNLLVLFSGVQDRVSVVTGAIGGVGSLEVRENTWAGAWAGIQKDPIIGSGLDATNQAVFGPTVTHNVFLHYWYQGGLLMFVLSIVIFGYLLWRCWRSVRLGVESVVAGVLVMIIFFALTAAFFNQLEYWLPILLATASVTPEVAGEPPGMPATQALVIERAGVRHA